MKDASDAEVYNLCIPRRVDKDVGRLQVGVHDKLLMRVLNTIAHCCDERGDAAHGFVAIGHMTFDRNAPDQFHDQIGCARFVYAAIEQLGANIGAGSGADFANIYANAPKDVFGRSLALMADLVRNPAFAAEELERQQSQTLDGLR